MLLKCTVSNMDANHTCMLHPFKILMDPEDALEKPLHNIGLTSVHMAGLGADPFRELCVSLCGRGCGVSHDQQVQ